MRTPHPREHLGNRLICDSLAISYSRGDIDDTIAEEDENEDDDDDEGNDDDSRVRDGDMSNGHGAAAAAADDDDTALLEQVVIGRQRRSSGHQNSRGGRGKSRSVSPGARVAAAAAVHHDYVNSAPGAARILGEAAGFGGSIPAIPPPPRGLTKQGGDSEDPYGKEFDAIGSRAKSAKTAVPSTTGSRINGRVLPPAQQPEVRKELASIPPRLRNGFVTGPSPSGSGGV